MLVSLMCLSSKYTLYIIYRPNFPRLHARCESTNRSSRIKQYKYNITNRNKQAFAKIFLREIEKRNFTPPYALSRWFSACYGRFGALLNDLIIGIIDQLWILNIINNQKQGAKIQQSQKREMEKSSSNSSRKKSVIFKQLRHRQLK